MTGGHVEVRYTGDPDDVQIMPHTVLVNGTDVGFLTENGFRIEPGTRDTPTTVTLVLLPSSVTLVNAPVVQLSDR